VLNVTISVGGTPTGEGDTVEEIIRRADKAMYESKKAGRNRTTIVEAPAPISPRRGAISASSPVY